MAFKEFDLQGVGKVKIYKRRGTRGLRLSLHPENYVRVTMPTWLPYKTGLDFARSRRTWINQHRQPLRLLRQNMKIGKQYQLKFIASNIKQPRTAIAASRIMVQYPSISSIYSADVQNMARKASLRALKKEAPQLLSLRLEQLAKQHRFKYKIVKFRYLKSRWGSCTSKKEITLNIMLLNLPWQLIDHVILHELLHTKVLKHGPKFWKEFEKIEPEAKSLQKKLRHHQPAF